MNDNFGDKGNVLINEDSVFLKKDFVDMDIVVVENNLIKEIIDSKEQVIVEVLKGIEVCIEEKVVVNLELEIVLVVVFNLL